LWVDRTSDFYLAKRPTDLRGSAEKYRLLRTKKK
jgi:hypothetical protein